MQTSAALGDGGPGERCNYEWAAEGSRKDVGQVHDVGLHGASAGLGGCAQGPDALGTGGGRTRVGRAVAAAAAAAAAAISASPGTIVLLGLGLC